MGKPISRREALKTIRDMPIESVLLVNKSELTSKQKTFAKAVALGETGAGAYRQAYKTQAKPKHQSLEANRLKQNPAIAREIEAYKLANEAAAYRTAAQLRDLVIHSLTQVLIDPETNAAQRIQAAKVLGTVTEVAAFTERKEITNIAGSDVIKAKIMAELNSLMMGSGSTDIEDVDSISLLDEIKAGNTSNDDDLSIESATEIAENPDFDSNLTSVDGYYRGSDPNKKTESLLDLHTNPHSPHPSESTPINFPTKG